MSLRRRPDQPRRISARDKTALDRYYRRCAIPKTFRAPAKRLRQSVRATTISATRIRVWLRAQGACEFCGDRERDSWRKLQEQGSARPGEHQLHEVFISRAQGRGLPPADLFNERNCARVCPFCHDDHHAERISVSETVAGQGCRKPLEVRPRRPGTVDELPAWATRLLTKKQTRP